MRRIIACIIVLAIVFALCYIAICGGKNSNKQKVTEVEETPNSIVEFPEKSLDSEMERTVPEESIESVAEETIPEESNIPEEEDAFFEENFDLELPVENEEEQPINNSLVDGGIETISGSDIVIKYLGSAKVFFTEDAGAVVDYLATLTGEEWQDIAMDCVLEEHEILCWENDIEVNAANDSRNNDAMYNNLIVAFGYFEDELGFYVAKR